MERTIEDMDKEIDQEDNKNELLENKIGKQDSKVNEDMNKLRF